MLRAHDAAVVDADVHEQFVELDVLLRERVQEIVELQPGDGENRLLVQVRVVQPVQQVNAAGPRGGDADAEPARPFRIGAGGESGRLFVADLDKADIVLAAAQRLDNAVDPVARNAEHDSHTPVDQCVDQDIRCCHRTHGKALAGTHVACHARPLYIWRFPFANAGAAPRFPAICEASSIAEMAVRLRERPWSKAGRCADRANRGACAGRRRERSIRSPMRSWCRAAQVRVP